MNVKLLQTKDQTYVTAIMALYTFPETTSGFLVLCLPVFPKFFSAIMPRIFPRYWEIVASLKAKTIFQSRTPPDACMAGNNHNKPEERRRSLWHIPTDLEATQISIETRDSTKDLLKE
jgi:hypothetical protein